MLAVGAVACGPAVRSASEEAVKGAAPAAAGASLGLLEDQRTRQRVADVLGTPEMQDAIQELSSGLSAGVVKGLASDEMTAHMTKLVEQFMRAFVNAFAQSAGELGPSADALQARADRFASTLSASVTRSIATEIPQSLAPALHKAIVDDLGPAMGEVMQKDMAPGFAAMMKSADVQSALAQTTREVARQAVLGSNEGLAELSEKKQRNEGGSPLGTIGAFFVTRTWLVVLIVAAVVFAIPILWLLRERRTATRYRQDAERRANRASALLAAIERSGDRGWSNNVLELLREQLVGDEGTRASEPAEAHRGPGTTSSTPRHA
ncbi:MAG: hypothetical protein JWP87_984 [Labilithrix sp.]|nr:hypothetical protein [Labilithrix sp.]